MGWQERQREIQDALGVLKKQQKSIGKKGRHGCEESVLDRAARIKALELGPCRVCQVLIIEYEWKGSLRTVSLRCEKGLSPLDLHRPYVCELGEVPECTLSTPF